jgi:tRNA A-37 threonylcarbamoyl transferase component Bud32
LITIRLDGIKWHYLTGETADWLSRVGKSLRVRVVKATSYHAVYRHDDGLYFKVFHYPFYRSFRSRRNAKACKDGTNALFLQEKGIATPEVLAFGEERGLIRLKRDILITREAPNIRTMPEFIGVTAPCLTHRERCDLIRKFARVVKALHEWGVYHPDINFGNLFITGPREGFQFVLLDLDKMKRYPQPISTAFRIQNLADLFLLFRSITSVSQRFYFLNAYEWPQPTKKKDLRRIEAMVHTTLFTRGKERARKCLSGRGGFTRMPLGPFIVFYPPKHPEAPIVAESLVPELETMQKNRATGSLQTGLQKISIDIFGKPFLLTQFPLKKPKWAFFKNKSNLAMHTWRIAWGGFSIRRIPLLLPLLLIIPKPDSTPKPSYIVYEHIPDIQPLDRFWKSLDESGKKDLLIRIGHLIGHMHRAGCMHGNLAWENILVDGRERLPKLLFHGIESARIYKRTPKKAAGSDIRGFLAELEKNEPAGIDRQFFIRSYEKRSGLPFSADI